MTGKGGDYDGWLLRLIEKAEDILFSFNLVEWLEFANGKIEPIQGYPITKAQADVLSENRDIIWEMQGDAVVGIKQVTRYRDAKGRWSKEPTTRAETRLVFRGERQKFIKSETADRLIKAELDARGIRKKPKSE